MEQWKLIRCSLQILTPAFHFKILDDFIDVFNEQSAVLARKLSVEVGSEAFNLFPYVTLCTLDIVCGESHAVQGEVSPQVSTNRLLIASQKPPWDARSTRRATASRSTSRRSMGKRKKQKWNHFQNWNSIRSRSGQLLCNIESCQGDCQRERHVPTHAHFALWSLCECSISSTGVCVCLCVCV